MSSLGPDGRMLGPIFTCTGYRWMFILATYYADLNGRIRPKAVVANDA
jgi:hypothetical protein